MDRRPPSSIDLVQLDVQAPSRPYVVTIGDGILDRLPALLDAAGAPARRFVVSNPLVWRLHAARLETLRATEPILVPDGERFKHLQTVARVYEALIRVNAEPQHREEILRTTDIFRAKVVDVTPLTFTLEATGDEAKLEALIELLRPMGIQELVRTGKVAIARGPKTRARRTEAPRKPRVSEDPRVVGFAD